MLTARQKREIVILVAVVAVAIVAGSFFRTCSNSETRGVPSHSASPRIVATVNDTDVRSEDVDNYFRATIEAMEMRDEEMPQKMRREISRTALSQIVEGILLAEGAEARGVSASDEEVDSFIDTEVRSEFDSEEEFLSSLEADVGLSLDDLRKMVRSWILRDKMIDLFAADIEVSEEEIDAELKMFKEILKNHPGGDVPLPSRDEVAANLARQKAEAKYALWMDTLMASAEIEILDPELQASEPLGDAASQTPGEAGHQGQAEGQDTDIQPDDTEE